MSLDDAGLVAQDLVVRFGGHVAVNRLTPGRAARAASPA